MISGTTPGVTSGPRRAPEPASTLVRLILDIETIRPRTPQIEHERAVAVHDFIGDNRFYDKEAAMVGPFAAWLAFEEGNRLRFCFFPARRAPAEAATEAGAGAGESSPGSYPDYYSAPSDSSSHGDHGEPLYALTVPMDPLRRPIRDYVCLTETYFQAIRTWTSSQLETVDMARRALHNEAAEHLLDLLEGPLGSDLATMRRLFTLICVLWVHR